MNWLKGRKRVVLALVIAAALSAVAAVAAQGVRYPTYEYYGRVLNVDEFLQLVEEGTPLHCAHLPSVGHYLTGLGPFDYVCFHTLEEADAYSSEVLAPEWERIARENPAPQFPPPPRPN